jgi:hypothetical protein
MLYCHFFTVNLHFAYFYGTLFISKALASFYRFFHDIPFRQAQLHPGSAYPSKNFSGLLQNYLLKLHITGRDLFFQAVPVSQNLLQAFQNYKDGKPGCKFLNGQRRGIERYLRAKFSLAGHSQWP